MHLLISLIFLILPGLSLTFYTSISAQVTFTSPCSEEVASREGNFQIESASDPTIHDDSSEDLQRVPEFSAGPEEQVESTKEPALFVLLQPKLEINTDTGKRFPGKRLLDQPESRLWASQDDNFDINQMKKTDMMIPNREDEIAMLQKYGQKTINYMNDNRELPEAITEKPVIQDKNEKFEEKLETPKKEQFIIYDQPTEIVSVKEESKDAENGPQTIPIEENKENIEKEEPVEFQETSAIVQPEPKKTQPENNDEFDLKTIEDIFPNSTVDQGDKLPQHHFDAASEPDHEEDTVNRPGSPVTTITPINKSIEEEPSQLPITTEELPNVPDIHPTPFLPMSVIMTTVTPRVPETDVTTTESGDQDPNETESPVEEPSPHASPLETTVIPPHLDEEFPYLNQFTEENVLPKLEAELTFTVKHNLTEVDWKNNIVSSLPEKDVDEEVLEFLLARIYMWLTMLKLEKEKEPEYRGTFWSQVISTLKCIGIRKCDIFTTPTEISQVPLKEGPNIPRKRHATCQCQRAEDIQRIVYMIEQIHRIRIAQGVHSSTTM